MNKYHNRKTTIDGITFDSNKEAERYAELKMMERAGIISDLKLQPSFLLQDGFDYRGQKIRPITYTADFEYIDRDNGLIIEDAKGMRTDVYKLKKKMFLFKYPDVNFVEV